MDYRHILHLLSPLANVSPFDVNMAVDAGFDVVVPYTRVELKDVVPLIQDAIFSRGPKGVKATGAFIGGAITFCKIPSMRKRTRYSFS